MSGSIASVVVEIGIDVQQENDSNSDMGFKTDVDFTIEGPIYIERLKYAEHYTWIGTGVDKSYIQLMRAGVQPVLPAPSTPRGLAATS